MTDWLAQIKARLGAATPGPWECIGDSVFGTYSYIRKTKSHWPITEMAKNEDHIKNGQFIANAPQDIATLLKAIEVKDEALKHADKELKERAYY